MTGSADIVIVLTSLKVSVEVSVSVCARLFHEVTVDVLVTVEVVVRADPCDVATIVVVVLLVGHVLALFSRSKRPCGGIENVNEVVVESWGNDSLGTIKAEDKERAVASKTTRKEWTNISAQ